MPYKIESNNLSFIIAYNNVTSNNFTYDSYGTKSNIWGAQKGSSDSWVKTISLDGYSPSISVIKPGTYPEYSDDNLTFSDTGYWYKWDTNILHEQGLDTKILKQGGCFFVNYDTPEVIYSEGETIDNVHYYYSLTAIEEAFLND